MKGHSLDLRRYNGNAKLSDDLVLALYNLVDFETFLDLRLVCKQWYNLSFGWSALSRFYNAAHLRSAFGPVSWHTPEALALLLIRNRQLNINIASDKRTTIIRSVQVFDLPAVTDLHSIKVFGPLLFTLIRNKSIRCYDLSDPRFRTLWDHEFPESDSPRLICSYENHDTGTEGCSVASLVLTEFELVSCKIITFKFHVRRHWDGKVAEITLKSKNESGRIRDLVMLPAVQGDWILSWGPFMTLSSRLVHIPSSQSYELLQRDQNQLWRKLETVFAGNRFVASVMWSDADGKIAIAVYEIPDPAPDGERLRRTRPWSYFVPIEEFIKQIQFLATTDSEATTTLHFVVGACYAATPGIRYMKLLDITLSHNGASYKVTPFPSSGFGGPFQLGLHLLRVFDPPTFVPDGQVEKEDSDKGLSCVSLAVDEGGTYSFRERGCLRIPKDLELKASCHTVLDELLGRIYVFAERRGVWQVHVISFI